MEVKETPAAALRRPSPTPKSLIHDRYGTQACYIVEEVQQSVDSICPGLVIAQKSQILYRCCLVLPELSVTSDTFTRKKDAEQSAAKMAVEKVQFSKNIIPSIINAFCFPSLILIVNDHGISNCSP